MWDLDGFRRADSEAPYSVSEFLDHCNTVLAREFGEIIVEGEVASFKVNQGKWVFFDLKDNESSVNCFMPLFQLSTAITDGMKIRIKAVVKMIKWGKFSLTVKQIIPVGEGNIKKSFELLKKKLEAEGLFDPARKRPLPRTIRHVGVISSTGAAGYKDFLRIIDNRWGGLKISVANTQVQGLDAPGQIIKALEYINNLENKPDVIAIIRGGGSADDLFAFNDEALARAIAASGIPVITGIGHEVDESLADLVADVRASTPSNVAERLTPDRAALLHELSYKLASAKSMILTQISRLHDDIRRKLELYNPDTILEKGYAVISGKISPGSVVNITTFKQIITAEVKDVTKR